MESEVKEPAFNYHYIAAEEYLEMDRGTPEKYELHDNSWKYTEITDLDAALYPHY